MRKIAVAMGFCLLATLSYGATDKTKCAVIAGPISDTSKAFSNMYVAMQGLDYEKIGREFSGPEQRQFNKLDEIQTRFLPLLEEYLFELEALGLMMTRCSR